MERIIITDVDGALVDWNAGFTTFMEAEGYEVKNEADYLVGPRYGISEEVGMELVSKFNHSDGYGSLPYYKDAKDSVARLVENGFRFIAVTSAGDDPEQIDVRTNMLKRMFGDVFNEVICLPLMSSKETVLARWKDTGFIYVDDLIEHCESAKDLGLEAILVDNPCNQIKVPIMRTSPYTPWAGIERVVDYVYGAR